MFSEIKISISKLLPVNVIDSIEVAADYIPYFAYFNRTRKVNRAIARIEKNENSIRKLNALSGLTKDSIDFYSELVLPIFLEDFFEEHEDAKIHYLLNGIYSIILEENKNESQIYHYFETLRSLHYSDIRRLCYIAEVDSDDYFTTPDLVSLLDRTDNKLEKEGLILLPISKIMPAIGFSNDFGINDTRMTEYGEKFISFISEKT